MSTLKQFERPTHIFKSGGIRPQGLPKTSMLKRERSKTNDRRLTVFQNQEDITSMIRRARTQIRSMEDDEISKNRITKRYPCVYRWWSRWRNRIRSLFGCGSHGEMCIRKRPDGYFALPNVQSRWGSIQQNVCQPGCGNARVQPILNIHMRCVGKNARCPRSMDCITKHISFRNQWSRRTNG